MGENTFEGIGRVTDKLFEGYKEEPGIAGRFVATKHDKDGVLSGVAFYDEENFNFAYDIVDAIARKDPDKLAMLHISKDGTERRFTFKDMSDYSNMVANYFEYKGIQKGDRVIVVLRRHYQFWFTMLALHKIGAVAVPCSYLLTQKDFEYRFKTGHIDAAVCTAAGVVAGELEAATEYYPSLKCRFLVGGNRDGWEDYDKNMFYFSKEYKRREDYARGSDPSIMFFTSGTTSYPKMAEHSYKYALGHYVTARYWHQVDPDGIHFTVSDTGWGKALWGKLYGQWMCEAPIFTYDYEDFFAKEILGMIERYGITSFCAPPTVFRMLVHLDLTRYDLSKLRHVATAGEALNPEIYDKFYNATGLKIMEGFGQTETTLLIGNLANTEPRPGSMGRPNPQYDVHVMRPDGTLCDKGETGEIVVRTDEAVPCGLFRGYYLDEEKTAEAWHDGYYHTGDTAYEDEDGYLWYVGRVDDLIKSAGYRVGPFEIENEIMKLPYVLECAVTAVPDKVRGQAIKASVVLASGYTASDELRLDAMKYLKRNLASYKRPKYLIFVDELPKTSSGKIRRAEIKEQDWKKS